MKAKRKFLILVGLVILFGSSACGLSSSPEPSKPDDVLEDISGVVITLERTVCFGTCPAYKVTIQGDGTVIYNGYDFVAVEGERKYTIAVEDIRELIQMFYDFDFFSLEDEYVMAVTDHPSTTTSITIEGETKTVYRYGNGPVILLQIEDQIDEVAGTLELIEE